jgi:hypothetical protein
MAGGEGHKEHRARLRKRFAADSGAAMPDYELLELLLFHAIPRRDTKPLAKRLIDRFGSLAAVLAADPGDIAKVDGAGEATALLLKVSHQAGLRLAQADLRERRDLGSWDRVLDYCRATLAHLPRESFHVLFLDRKNGLIAAEQQSRGTVDLAYYITQGGDPETVAPVEEDIVRAYHEALCAGGVADYDWETCWHEYRLFALYALVFPILAAGLIDAKVEAQRNAIGLLISRGFAAARRLASVELLPA